MADDKEELGKSLLAKSIALFNSDPDGYRAYVDGLTTAEFDALYRALYDRICEQPTPLSAMDQALWDHVCGKHH